MTPAARVKGNYPSAMTVVSGQGIGHSQSEYYMTQKRVVEGSDNNISSSMRALQEQRAMSPTSTDSSKVTHRTAMAAAQYLMTEELVIDEQAQEEEDQAGEEGPKDISSRSEVEKDVVVEELPAAQHQACEYAEDTKEAVPEQQPK